MLVYPSNAKEFIAHQNSSHTSPFDKGALGIMPRSPLHPTVFNQIKFDELIRTAPLLHYMVIAQLAKHEKETTVVHYGRRIENTRQNLLISYPVWLLELVILAESVAS